MQTTVKYLGCLCLALFLSGCAALQDVLEQSVSKPEVSYQSMGIGAISREGIELKPVFAIRNPNGFSVPVDNLSYELAFNQKRMLSGSSESIGSIPAQGSKDVTLSVPLNREVFDAFSELLLNNKQLDYVIKGEAKVMGFSLPFEKAATFYRPSLNIGDFSVQKSSFQQIDLLLTLDIDNPNGFDMPLSNVSYSASSAGKAIFSGKVDVGSLKPGKNQIQLPVSLHPSDLFSSLFGLLKNPELPLRFSVDSPLHKTDKSVTLNLGSLLGN